MGTGPSGPFLELAGIERTGNYRVIDNAVPPDTYCHAPHAHEYSEAYYVLTGSFDVFVNGKALHAETGAFVFIPARAEHNWRTGPTGGRKLSFLVWP